MFEIYKTQIFTKWYEDQTLKVQLQIDGRLSRIVDHAHFGHIRDLRGGVFELKFNNGNRIYYTINEGRIVLLLSGGNKNSQSKDIKQAKKMAKEYK